MKKQSFFLLTGLLISFSLLPAPAFSAPKATEAKGEVVSSDPVYSSVTIKHGAIKGYGADETIFSIDSALLKNINRYDLVDFTIVDNKGDVRVTKITKTGVAIPEKEAGMGQVVQDVLVGTGEVAKGITTPIEPVHQVVGGTVDATTGATGSLLSEADNKAKTKF